MIHEDADGATIAKETIGAARECARLIGKIGPTFTHEEQADMQEAADPPSKAIDLKKRMSSTRER